MIKLDRTTQDFRVLHRQDVQCPRLVEHTRSRGLKNVGNAVCVNKLQILCNELDIDKPAGHIFEVPPRTVALLLGNGRPHLDYVASRQHGVTRTLKNAGARVVFASDWPVSPVDPILGIQAAVMRKPWAEDLPDQSFSLQESIAGYTVEGAYAEFMEHRKGRLKTGFMADLVVLSGDIEATAPEALHMVRPATTICGGKITYQA